MLGLGLWEIILIGVIALLVVGPEQLPGLARNLARFINEIKRYAEDFKKDFDDSEFKSLMSPPEESTSRKSTSSQSADNDSDSSYDPNDLGHDNDDPLENNENLEDAEASEEKKESKENPFKKGEKNE